MSSAPELAEAVVSPSNDASEVTLKGKQYLFSGAKLVPIVYPQARKAYIYRPGERPETRADGQVLDAAEILPGWSMGLTKLFDSVRR
ncbi:MAG: hypothetical protein ACRD04_10965 [Terriglobales bacterium]